MSPLPLLHQGQSATAFGSPCQGRDTQWTNTNACSSPLLVTITRGPGAGSVWRGGKRADSNISKCSFYWICAKSENTVYDLACQCPRWPKRETVCKSCYKFTGSPILPCPLAWSDCLGRGFWAASWCLLWLFQASTSRTPRMMRTRPARPRRTIFPTV